jgi:hypothetical protein
VWRRFPKLLQLTCLDFDQIAFTNLAMLRDTRQQILLTRHLALFEEVPRQRRQSMLHEEGAPSPTNYGGSNALSVANSDSADEFGSASAAWSARVAEARLEAQHSTRQ